MNFTRAQTISATEERFLGIPPWVVSGRCACGKTVAIRAYGLRSELQGTIKLVCEECEGETALPQMPHR